MLNNNFFLVFLLAHLIGDFVLQTDRIARLKASGSTGMSIHVVIVFLIQIIALSFFGFPGIAAATVGGIIHYFIDKMKLYLGQFIRKAQILAFAADQLLHVSVIAALTLIFSPYVNLTSSGSNIIRGIISIILASYVSTVGTKILLNDLNKKSIGTDFFKKGERLSDAALCIILASIGIYNTVLFLFSVPVFFVIYKRLQSAVFEYDLKAVTVKFISLTAIAIASALFYLM